ncbi:hypothetical protein EDD85DRAFT_962943 [Armillaria nabsnona]|nr:hypothetical protein EDD85DRAFT_962943 [Armillaria nabsnona]
MKRIVNESELPAIYISLSSFILMLRRLSLALSSHCSVKAESCIRGKPSPYRRLLFSPAYSVDLDKLSSTSVGTEARNTSENLPSNLRELGYRRDLDLTRYQGIHALHTLTQAFPPSLGFQWHPRPTTIAPPFDCIETRLCLDLHLEDCTPSLALRSEGDVSVNHTSPPKNSPNSSNCGTAFIALFAFESMASNSTLADYGSLSMETRLGSATMIGVTYCIAGEMSTLGFPDSSLVASDKGLLGEPNDTQGITHNKSGLWSWHLLRVRVMLYNDWSIPPKLYSKLRGCFLSHKIWDQDYDGRS